MVSGIPGVRLEWMTAFAMLCVVIIEQERADQVLLKARPQPVCILLALICHPPVPKGVLVVFLVL